MVSGLLRASISAALSIISLSVFAAEYPAPKEGTYVAKDFRFHTGEVMPEVKLHYATIGAPTGEPVLMLHGTAGSGRSLLTPALAGELFGAGQPLDATKYFIILPDAIGAGKSSKPSDGLRAKFPRYNYDDMVLAQYRLVTEGLGIRHLRLVIGNSMGGMHVWQWGSAYPDFMDTLVPMASQPSEMASRNWIMRRLLVDSIRSDPDWKNGDYTTQPKAVRHANAMFRVATSGGTLAYQKLAGTREKADKLAEEYLSAPFNADANDFMYQWDSSRDYNASPGLDKIRAPLLAINAADDERYPPETGLMEREIKRVKNGRLYLIPASEDTRGHGTTGMAKFWKQQLREFLQAAPKRTM
ncbi:MAG: alpha/beta fold hydrolase [Xanthobacteraceae bacterium]|nr:alpha/beta fold hydrolase [Xanthobacteraceae bacterium]